MTVSIATAAERKGRGSGAHDALPRQARQNAMATTADGRSTSVQAVVDYRPDETNVANRVAINSLRVLE